MDGSPRVAYGGLSSHEGFDKRPSAAISLPGYSDNTFDNDFPYVDPSNPKRARNAGVRLAIAMTPAPKFQSFRDGLGYRAKIGVLVPYTNTIAQPEYESFRPPGVTNHVARMEQTSRTRTPDDMESYRENLKRGTEFVKRGLDQLLPCGPQMVVIGHSVDSFRGGLKGASAMKEDLESYTGGVPVTLSSHAFVAALKTLGVGRRLAAVTPYWPPGDEQVLEFFSDAGYDVCKIVGLKAQSAAAIAAISDSTVIAVLRELAAEKPDVIVQPGTNLPTARLSAEASTWLGIPVVSCNTATYWHALRTMGLNDRMDGYGPLFSEH